MYSPIRLVVSNTMPNKTRRRARRRKQASVAAVTNKMRQVQIQPKRKATPFADAGAITGQRLGSFFNLPMLKGVGRWLGSGIGTIMGSGDYTMVGSNPSYNVLTNGAQIPKFQSTKQTNIVCHREYLGDLVGTTSFTLNNYPLNPGISNTFPWLSSISQNYQEYRFHGLVFEFRSLITDFVTSGAPGVIIMATNYNAAAPVYDSKQEMENSEYAVSTKPTTNLMHGVECAASQTVLPQAYTRTGAVPAGQDPRLYDLGNFQIATQGNPAQLLGELWVSYCVEFIKPVLPITVGGDIACQHINRNTSSSTNLLGTVQNYSFGTLGATATGTTLTFMAQPGNYYFLTVCWNGASVTSGAPTVTLSSGLKSVNFFVSGSTGNFTAPQNGVVSVSQYTDSFYVQCVANSPGNQSFVFGTSGGIPTPGSVDIFITTVDSSIIA